MLTLLGEDPWRWRPPLRLKWIIGFLDSAAPDPLPSRVDTVIGIQCTGWPLVSPVPQRLLVPRATNPEFPRPRALLTKEIDAPEVRSEFVAAAREVVGFVDSVGRIDL